MLPPNQPVKIWHLPRWWWVKRHILYAVMTYYSRPLNFPFSRCEPLKEIDFSILAREVGLNKLWFIILILILKMINTSSNGSEMTEGLAVIGLRSKDENGTGACMRSGLTLRRRTHSLSSTVDSSHICYNISHSKRTRCIPWNVAADAYTSWSTRSCKALWRRDCFQY